MLYIFIAYVFFFVSTYHTVIKLFGNCFFIWLPGYHNLVFLFH